MSTRFAEENLKAALKLAAADLPIFPAVITWNEAAQKNDKRPAISQWQSRATTDAEMIKSWWATFHGAELMPGIELGRAGLLVVDLDRHAGAADGVAAFRTLAAGQKLPLTPITRTASNGYHVYFKQLEGGRSATGLVTCRPAVTYAVGVAGSSGLARSARMAPGARSPIGRGWSRPAQRSRRCRGGCTT